MNKTEPTKKTTFDEECREYGFKSSLVAQKTKENPRTLRGWFKSRAALMRYVLIGIFVERQLEENADKIEDFINKLKKYMGKDHGEEDS